MKKTMSWARHGKIDVPHPGWQFALTIGHSGRGKTPDAPQRARHFGGLATPAGPPVRDPDMF